MEKNHKLKAVLNIIGGILTHLTIGTVYLWGNISIYVTSYYRLHNYPNMNIFKVNILRFPTPLLYSLGLFLGV